MRWWLPRTLAALAALLLGAGLGALWGHDWTTVVVGTLLGGAAGIALVIARDAVRGRRLMRWLRGTHRDSAPRDEGYWGELGYRFEKALREQEKATEAERQRLEQFLSAIEASPNGVMLLDANEQIEWCNSLACEHFGLDRLRDRLQRLTNLVRVPTFVAYLQAGEYGDPVVFSSPAHRRTLSVLIRPYGEGMKLVLSQDITERERADAMRRDFVANVSHEIRTPLTVLAGFVETLSQLPLSEAERHRVLALMAQQTGRMQALVTDLLTLAQLEGSPPPTLERWHSVRTLLRQVQADSQALSGGRHQIAFVADTDDQIAGSEVEWHSALANLVTNAIRYTPDGGRIEVRWLRRDDSGAAIEVCDSGVGIAREHLPRLTERFYRVDSSRSRETGGTGLGLAIVKHVVQRHGGEIEVESEPGKGSTFRLVVPALRVRAAPVNDRLDGRSL